MKYQIICKNCGSTSWIRGNPSGSYGVHLDGKFVSEWESRITNIDCDHPNNMWEVIDEEEI